MIIKVMTRKEPSFRQLLAYVTKDASDARYVLTHNLMDSDLGAIAAEFETNAKLLRAHVNGTVMFHDILSITRSKSLGLERQKEILQDIARDYIARRAPDHLVFATLHHDQPKHLHYHFVISANPHGEWKRAHLSKPQLRTLQTEMETRVMSRYPELEQTAAMSRKARGPKLSQPGHEMLRRAGKVPERQRVTSAVAGIFASAQSKDDLFVKLTDARLELYRRGKSGPGRASGTIGVRDLDTGRNHRLVTLGLADAFKAMSDRIETGLKTPLTKSRPPDQQMPQRAAQSTHKPPSTLTPIIPKEEPVDILQMALQGVGAVVDALSITTDSGKLLEAEKAKVKAAVHNATPATSSPPAQAHVPVPQQAKPQPLTEAERIAQERLADIAETRQQQDQQLGQQQGSRLNR